MSDVTQILSAIEQGDQKASEQLLPLVYEELRKLATAKMAQSFFTTSSQPEYDTIPSDSCILPSICTAASRSPPTAATTRASLKERVTLTDRPK